MQIKVSFTVESVDFGFYITVSIPAVATVGAMVVVYIVMPFFHFSRSACSDGKDILFCNLGLCIGLSELQMCMAFSVGFSLYLLNFSILIAP